MPSSVLELPQLSITYAEPLPEQQYLLIAGGREPAPPWLKTIAAGRHIWAIDHGIDSCQKAGLIPEHLIGDGDSASASAWNWAEKNAAVVERYAPEKDLTDTQLALSTIKKEQDNPFVLLTGAFGGRFDHAFSTLFSFAFSGLHGGLADEREACFFLQEKQTLQIQAKKRPKAISLLPFQEPCTGVSIHGTHWPLQKAALSQRLPMAVSNELNKDDSSFTVSLDEGTLGVYLYWE